MARIAVILAAGEGKRLGATYSTMPKGLIEVGGETLVGRSIRLLRSRGVNEILVVVGHRAERYYPLAALYSGVRLVCNNHYAESGSLGSLMCAIRELDGTDEIVILESDIYFEPRALDLLLNIPYENLLLTTNPTGAGDEVWVEAPEGRLRTLSKNPYELNEVHGELVGMWRLAPGAIRCLCRVYGEGGGSVAVNGPAYETDGMSAISRDISIHVHCEPGLLWGEIDDEQHLTRVREQIAPQILAAEARVSVPRRILLNPGPATTTDTVKQSLVVPDVCPREMSFLTVLSRVRDALTLVVGDPKEFSAVPFAASGTGALEAVIGSVVPLHGGLAVLDNGDYGERLADIARQLAIPTVHVRAGWAEPFSREDLAAALDAASVPLTHVAAVHHETSTGMLNDLETLSALCRERGLEFIVDAMSSYGAVPLQGAHFDYLVSTANKCLQGMAGISFVIARNESLNAARAIKARTHYFDLVAQYNNLSDTGQTRFTCPPQILYALDQALAELAVEKVEGRRQRYDRNHALLLRGVCGLGFEPLLSPEHQSRILLCVRSPEEHWFKFDELSRNLLGSGITIYPGKPRAPATFRLSILGALSEADIQFFLLKLAEYVRHARHACGVTEQGVRC